MAGDPEQEPEGEQRSSDGETPLELNSTRKNPEQVANVSHGDEPAEPDPPPSTNRSEHFDQGHEPFKDDDNLQLQDDEVSGPIWFMNATRARFRYITSSAVPAADTDELEQLDSKATDERPESLVSGDATVEHDWTSRNNRKGRHAIIIRESDERANPYATPAATTGPRSMLRGMLRMLTVFMFRDISYLVAVAFSFACTILVVNAILSFLPYINEDFRSSTKLYRIEAVLGAIGCTLFFTASLFAFSEAVNANRRGCFGWKLVHTSHTDPNADNPDEEKANITLLVPDGSCSHHHDSYKIVTGHPDSWSEEVSNRRAQSTRPETPLSRTRQPWIWLPSAHELRTHLRYDYGFVCATMLACSSLVYCAMAWAAVVTMFRNGQVAPWIRLPQLVSAVTFAVSCTLSMIETQRDWWRPSPSVIGWHANVFNVIGSVGFVLTAVFGYTERMAAWVEYQFGCAYLWGSLAFLIGSVLQWYEALDKYPVERVKEKES